MRGCKRMEGIAGEWIMRMDKEGGGGKGKG